MVKPTGVIELETVQKFTEIEQKGRKIRLADTCGRLTPQ